MRDEKLYQKVIEVTNELELSYYPKLLLVSMIYRRLEHPSEKMDKILEVVTSTVVPKEFEKTLGKTYMKLSVNKELETLEDALHECTNLPEELFQGLIISESVKYYAKKVIDTMD